ncbi:hypothetical protein N9J04_01550 [Candidatus Pelagibacter sp.]|nr:hypothetical protein [Candidatus Pelagibacter sp.]
MNNRKEKFDSSKKNIFITIEFKHREFLSKLLLSSFAIKAGFRVYIGSLNSIIRLINVKNQKGGIFFHKGGFDLDGLLKIKKKCDSFVILDEELGTEIKNYAQVAKRRIWPDTEKYNDRYFVIGQYGYKASCDIFPKMKNSIRCTGWPRVDLWRPENESLFKEKTQLISKKYGSYVLFTSDFGYNSQKIINDRLEVSKNSEWKSVKTSYLCEKKNSEIIFKEYKKFLEILKKYDKIKDCPLIIVRPHPAEDIDAWFEFSKELSNIKVIYEGEITPWINASSGVLHRGCTSAIQAHMRGLPIGYFISEKSFIQDGTPHTISQHLYTFDDLFQFCISAINENKNTKSVTHHDEFKRLIHIENDKFASELIVEDLIKLKTTLEPCYQANSKDVMIDILLNIKAVSKKVINHLLKIEQKIGIASDSRKIPGGINKHEVEDFFFRFDSTQRFKIKKIFKDCVEIDI